MFKVVHDDVQCHDVLFPACSKAMYDFFYQNGTDHSNCLDNINRALGTNRNIIQPINFFMNTRVEENGKIVIAKPLSKAGDQLTLRALENCIIGSVSEADTNNGNCTSLEVLIDEIEGS